jgi:hypothetical protein
MIKNNEPEMDLEAEATIEDEAGETYRCQVTLKGEAGKRLLGYCKLGGVPPGTIASELTRRFALSPEVTSLLKSHGKL